jgi:DNA polymerase III sliding clamp (beta) subunit (PCNA family)
MEMIVPGRTLLRFLEAVQGDVLSISVENPSAPVHFSCSNVELTLRQFALADWPRPETATGSRIELEGSVPAAIRRVMFAVSTDPDRGVLTGVHLKSRTATATDNLRLAQAKLEQEIPECVIPAEFLSFPLKVLKASDRVEFELDARGVCIRDSLGFWSSQLLLGEYPDVSTVLQVATSGHVSVLQQALRNAIERISVLEAVNTVELSVLNSTEIEISAGDEETGRIQERLSCDADWTGQLCFTLAHLRDAVRAVDDTLVVIQPSAPLKPVLIPSSHVEQALLPRRS